MKKTIKLILLLLLTSSSIFAQSSDQRATLISQSESVLYDSYSNVKFLRFGKDSEYIESDIPELISRIQSELYPNSEFKYLRRTDDKAGFSVIEYQQYTQGHRIEYGILKFQLKGEKLLSFNGEMYQSSSILNTKPNINQSAALKLVEKQGREEWKMKDKELELELLEELWFPINGNLIQAYKVDIYSHVPTPQRYFVYVSSSDGKVLFTETRIHESNSLGTANTLYSGNGKVITTDSLSPTVFHLNETGARKIHTWDMNTGTSYMGSVNFVDTDNNWTTATNLDLAANDVHYSTEKTWDYYLSTFGRNSFDNFGSTINSYVHYDVSYPNAFWDGLRMTYGDGSVIYSPFTSTAIVGHEITHGVTNYAANLVYAYESGALNESFSDVMGVAIDFYTNPTTANFLMGDQISTGGTPFRNMQNPNAVADPDTYLGTYWATGPADNGGVHTNSGVQNYWYYLLCRGGTGVNDNGDAFVVDSIGMAKATAIAYRNLTTYLTANSQYVDARTYSIQSAIDLYGQCSNEVVQVTNAWHAVGVGGIFNTYPAANFYSSDTILCQLGDSAHFVNTSINSSQYTWNFGDGTGSTATNPVHTYAALGNYTVTLIATDTGACGNADTLIKTSYIHVMNQSTPTAASCIPITSYPSSNFGIQNVKLNTINATTGSSLENYLDLTCSPQTTLTANTNYLFQVQTYALSYTKAWIDYNNNGVFSSSELIYNGNHDTLHTTLVHIPLTGFALNTPIRMRVISSQYNIANACDNILYGQAEDYTVRFTTSAAPPIADFQMSDTSIYTSDTIFFYDVSANAPTSWSWSIQGGIPASGNTPSLFSVFSTPGTYNVTLTVSNAYGTDSITKVVHVSFPNIQMCTNGSNTVVVSPTGNFEDSGGPTGNYGNNETCTLLISPGGCTDSITLSFSLFDTEFGYDYLDIYDGTGSFGNQLLHHSGSTLPSSVTATSGSMYILWQSDPYVVGAGYHATWQTHSSSSVPPVANFSFSPTSPPHLDTFHFTNTSTNALSYDWDFGDGASSTLQNPSHVYSLPGTYTVTLIASNCNYSDTITQMLTVQASPTIQISPSSYSLSLGCNDSITLPMYISNLSGGTLNWDAENAAEDIELLVWYYGANMSLGYYSEYHNSMNAIRQQFPGISYDSTSTTSPSSLQSALIGKSVLFIPELEYAYHPIVNLMEGVIYDFASNGGTVVLCSDDQGLIVDTLNFFDFTSVTNSSSSFSATVVNSSSPLTDSIFTSSVQSSATTVMYNVSDTDYVSVIEYNGASICGYKNIGDGKFISIGYDFYTSSSDMKRLLTNAVQWTSGADGVNSLTPNSGSLAAGQSDTTFFTLHSAGLNAGIDTSYIVVYSNDTASLVDSVPVYLTISPQICAGFEANTLGGCNGIVDFTDVSTNFPTTWSWDFGDGSTSSIQNPSHTYTSSGTFTVRLIASNSIYVDTVLQSVTVSGGFAPIPTTCSTYTSYSCCGHGLTYFEMGNISKTSAEAAVEGCVDFTCTDSTSLFLGSYMPYTVTSGRSDHNLIISIDTNNDGIFTIDERLVDTFITNSSTYSGGLLLPGNIDTNVTLRMRVYSGDYISSVNLCNGSLTYGQTEDYSVRFKNWNAAPIANFIIIDSITATGIPVQLLDISQGNPTSWNWSMPSATVTNASTQNPSTSYPLYGTYPITLIVSNGFGSDTITKYVTVANAINLCSGTTSNQTTPNSSGILYDSGGPSGYYSDNESCTLLISPGACTDSITLSFMSFQTEPSYDFMRVYDGNSTAGTLLLHASGSTIPPTVTAHSGEMFIRWFSDASSSYSGFSALWQSYFNPTASGPVANFSYSPVSPPLLDSVHFTNTSNLASSYVWDFGDGSTSFDANPSHAYALPGTYLVTLIASACNISDTATQTVTVQASPIIQVLPSSLSASLTCNDSITLPIYVSNMGGGTLNWDGEPTLPEPELLVWYYGANMSLAQNGTYHNTMNALRQQLPNLSYDSTNTANASSLQSALAGKNVLLLPTLPYANLNVLNSVKNVIHNFMNNGGTVIVCPGQELYILDSLDLIEFSNAYYLSGTFNSPVVYANSPITNGINTGTVSTETLTSIYSVTDQNYVTVVGTIDTSVCGYKPFGYGKFILLGFNFYNYNNDMKNMLSNAVRWVGSAYEPWTMSLKSGTLSVGHTDTSYVTLTSASMDSGIDTSYILIHSNDTSSFIDSIPVYLTVSPQICADFDIEVFTGCSGIVEFTDLSTHSPTTWNWDFGDGGTSNVQNPTYTYSTSGTYTVRLIVSNSGYIDTSIQIVTVVGGYGPIPAACNPSTWFACCGVGLTHFSMGNINKYSQDAETEGCVDFSCTDSTTLLLNSIATYTVTSGTNYHTLVIAIDTNNDGMFTADEVFVDTPLSVTTYSNSFYIPGGIDTGVALRMRVFSGSYPGITGFCDPYLAYAQTEDYSVRFQSWSGGPIADFDIISSPTAVGDTVQLINQSQGNPTSWSWSMPGANITSSTTQNAMASYSATGQYPITLIVSNSLGSDTITKYVSVNTLINMCSSLGANAVTTSAQGIFYDSGGPLGNYNNNENCTLLISPGSCTDSILLTFDEFSTEISYDYLRVYDGTSTTGSLLLSATGYNIPSPVIALSGSMYITWESDYSGIEPGFKAHWEATGSSAAAGFSYAPSTVQVGTNVQFTNLSSNATTYNWNFGDGSTSTLTNPQHQYSAPGTYICRLIISGCGIQDTTIQTIVVQPLSVTTAFHDSSDYCVSRKYFVPTVGNNYNALQWDFGDGTTATGGITQVQTHVYPEPGNYTVTMIANSSSGNASVSNSYSLGPWNASIAYPAGSYTNAQSIPFSINNGTGINFMSWDWNFGDGNTSAQAAPSHQYANQGIYYISTLLSDASGCAIRLYDTIGIDPDGITVYSDNDDISVYPIPFSSALNIDFKDLQYADKLSLRLINALGQIVYHREYDKLDLSTDLSITPDVASGIYNLWIYLDDKKYNVRVMKE